MNKLSVSQVFFLFLIILGTLLYIGPVLAESPCAKDTTRKCDTCGTQYCNECFTVGEVEECHWSEECDKAPEKLTIDIAEWNEYSCNPVQKICVDEYIRKKICSGIITRSCDGCEKNSSGKYIEKCTSWSEPRDIDCETNYTKDKDCESWQTCSGGTNWTKNKSTYTCDCKGDCLEPVKGQPRYYDSPYFPRDYSNPEKSLPSNNISLPVKLDWDDVELWQKNDGVESYKIQFNNDEKNIAVNITASEFVPNACTFRAGSNESWKVVPCCGFNETDCKPFESEDVQEWSFSTALTPELKTPKDKDWTGPFIETEEPVLFPVKLEWCPADSAGSYLLNIDRHSDGEFIWDETILETEGNLPNYLQFEGLEALTKDTDYDWKVTICSDTEGNVCETETSQKWGFRTEFVDIAIPKKIFPQYNPNFPNSIPVVNLLSNLEWSDTLGAITYFYEIKKNNTTVRKELMEYGLVVNFDHFWKDLNLDTIYNWQVSACSSHIKDTIKNCEENTTSAWKFQTTGKTPQNININNSSFPIQINWEDIPGALSYKYEIKEGSNIILENTIKPIGAAPKSILNFGFNEGALQEKNYSFRVKTCADQEGLNEYCGSWTDKQIFETKKLPAPQNTIPENDGEMVTNNKKIEWDNVEGANYYLATLSLKAPLEQESEECQSQGGKEILRSIIGSNSIFLNDLICLGTYSWNVQACLDNECSQAGYVSETLEFSLIEPDIPSKAGLVPCGRYTNNLDTPWNEMEKCEIKHLFFLFRIILDFLLWRVSLMILTLLTLGTGAYVYFAYTQSLSSMYDDFPNVLLKVKRAWTMAGQGYFIIFFAWIFLNMLLGLLGFSMGSWWQISF